MLARTVSERLRPARRRDDADHRRAAADRQASGRARPPQPAARMLDHLDARQDLDPLAQRLPPPAPSGRAGRGRPSAPRRARPPRARRRPVSAADEATEMTRIGTGCALMICSTASTPLIPGSSMSIVTRSGSTPGGAAIAASAVAQTDTTSIVLSLLEQPASAAAYVLESSQTRTRSCRGRRAHRADEPLDGFEQRVLVEAALHHVRVRAGFEPAAAVLLLARARSTTTTGVVARVRAGADRAGQLEAVHLGHLDVGQDELDLVVGEQSARGPRGRRVQSRRDSPPPRGCSAGARAP